MTLKEITFLLLALLSTSQARQGYGPGDQDWGFVEVHPHSEMFWWLHYTTADPEPLNRPLMIWLQGGPGSSGSGEGNILQSGLVDQYGNPREFSYVHLANVLYVDHPVGTGYSYVDVENGGTFSANTKEFAEDFLVLLQGFYKAHPEFQSVPLYIVGGSFGGKLAAAYAQKVHEAIEAGTLSASLQGVGMAYPAAHLWTSTVTMADVLIQSSIIDSVQYAKILDQLQEVNSTISEGNWEAAQNQVDDLIDYLQRAYDLNFLGFTSISEPRFDLTTFMDGTVSPILNITRPFGRQGMGVSTTVKDKMMPTTSSVEYLLKNNIQVVIYNGQLDWVISAVGTYTWIKELNWNGRDGWNQAQRRAIAVDGIIEAHVTEYRNLAFYVVKRAGHQLPNHNPGATKYILQKLLGY